MKHPIVEYDPESDILAIELSDLADNTLIRTLDLDDGRVVLQLGPRETPVSLEIFEASIRYTQPMLKALIPGQALFREKPAQVE